MTKEQYNKVCLLYQALTRRFDLSQNFYYDGFYKCFNPKHYAVRGENLETLKHFENLTFRDIYTDEHLAEHHFGDNYLDSKLVVVEEERICVIAELGQVFLYLLVSKLKNGIEQFLELVDKLQKEHKYLIRLEEDGRIMKMKTYLFDEFNGLFEQLENYGFVFHLLGKTNSSFLMQDWNNNIEIHLNRIRGLLKNVNSFDFSNVELLNENE
ncbi:hypothetical protein J1N09_01440 [Aureitalea sp. L0-47]|uniref:hypothetical protein n=1 Tax=Aureitalea sp. L0-47 TaxID=2816962 RepID=UPI002238F239|nr:hypothetical protein [Aureitalea sp. L0-47]MCW5518483.1 hypothetical protein [Aureitalea sp. L0-47]